MQDVAGYKVNRGIQGLKGPDTERSMPIAGRGSMLGLPVGTILDDLHLELRVCSGGRCARVSAGVMKRCAICLSKSRARQHGRLKTTHTLRLDVNPIDRAGSTSRKSIRRIADFAHWTRSASCRGRPVCGVAPVEIIGCIA